MNTQLPLKKTDNWTNNKIASKDWIRGFFRRQPQLSIRTPETTSLSRATSFIKKNVGDFFENLKIVYERHRFGPVSIYNIDETGLSTVQRTQKVIALRGTKEEGKNQSIDGHTREKTYRNGAERQRKNRIKQLDKNRKCSKNTGQKTIAKLADELTYKLEKNRKISSDDEIENVSVSDEALVESEEDFDEDDVIVLVRNFQINNFVLVKFDTKKTVYHYVGIIEEVNNSMATVKFMRASKIRNTFIFPDIEDVASVHLGDIKTKLLHQRHG